MVFSELEILLAEIARLIKNEELEKARGHIERAIDILCEMEGFAQKISSAIELLNLISGLKEFDAERLVSIKLCVPRPKEESEEEKVLYARFLAIYSSVAINFGLNPINEIEESDKILYELATKIGYLRQYASFTSLFYTPIYLRLGNVKKALKALDFVIDELEAAYRREKDETLLPLLGEIKAQKAKILLELGEKDKCLKLIEEARNLFKSLEGNYEDYLEFLDELEKNAKEN